MPGIWVLVAVTIGGSLWGVMGILLSVPVCSVLYSLFRQLVRDRLRKKQLPVTAAAMEEPFADSLPSGGDADEQKKQKETKRKKKNSKQ